VIVEWIELTPHHSFHKFRPLLPDEAPEVTYETATHFASTMVEFQTRI
jgi:hypothetical protein|tara:strand:+ start:24 stop:167 length:144 start_codon:yes stop_codon:yes gene_type:complete